MRKKISGSFFFLLLANGAHAASTLYTGPAGAFATDTWNANANWDAGSGTVPTGTLDVEVESGRTPWAVNLTPAYNGSLILRSNSTLGIGVRTTNNTVNALGTGTITMESGSTLIMRYSAAYTFNQSFILTGDATIQLSSSTDAQNLSRTFSQSFSGAHRLSL